MRNVILGIVVGLIIGFGSAFAYSHFMEQQIRMENQHELELAHAETTKALQEVASVRKENAAVTDQAKQLMVNNEKLRQQVAAGPAPATDGPKAPSLMASGFMKAGMEQQRRQKLLLLKSRLNLTPEQEAAVKAAMDRSASVEEGLAMDMLAGKKIDPQALKNMKTGPSLDETLDSILTPEQKTAYTQLKGEEKQNQVESVASFELNQMSPLLQLSDAQKDQVYTVLVQNHLDQTDPQWIKNNVASSSDPTAIIEVEAKAKEDALAKVLSPEQLAIYHKQAQSQLDMQKAMMQKMQAGGTVNVSVPSAP